MKYKYSRKLIFKVITGKAFLPEFKTTHGVRTSDLKAILLATSEEECKHQNNGGIIDNGKRLINRICTDCNKPLPDLECNCIINGYCNTSNLCPVHKECFWKEVSKPKEKIEPIEKITLPVFNSADPDEYPRWIKAVTDLINKHEIEIKSLKK